MAAVPAGDKGETLVDRLGAKLEIDVAGPTAINYFDRISKRAILAHREAIGGKALASRYDASKKHDLASSAEKIFAGSLPVEPEFCDAALAWIPDVMRFSHAIEASDPVEHTPELASAGEVGKADPEEPLTRAA